MSRIERDPLGEIAVDDGCLWGAQTQRSLEHFRISDERMPARMITALAAVKCGAAEANRELGLLDARLATAIIGAAEEVIAGRHAGEFPLVIWQAGSGTHTNMNLNEVIANRASELLGGPRGQGRLVHANDHVNLGQSSNDAMPSALHVAASDLLSRQLVPALGALRTALAGKAAEFAAIVKIGRTHLQDAVPLTLGQEFSGYAAQLAHAETALGHALDPLLGLAIGGTAVGTGLNTHPDFGRRVAATLARRFGLPFRRAANPFAAQAARDEVVGAHGALRTLAVALMKIANDIRWLASGPRSGLGEIILPADEPGSSIMPGKVNPSQCEALFMVCCQVLGNDALMGIAGGSGNFELNACLPLIAHAFLASAQLLGDAMRCFGARCIQPIVPDRQRIAEHLHASLMLATALVPHLGHDRAAAIALLAQRERLSLREAALRSGMLSAEQFDAWVRPEGMIGPQHA